MQQRRKEIIDALRKLPGSYFRRQVHIAHDYLNYYCHCTVNNYNAISKARFQI